MEGPINGQSEIIQPVEATAYSPATAGIDHVESESGRKNVPAPAKKATVWEKISVVGIFVPILAALFGAFGAFVASQTLSRADLDNSKSEIQRLEKKIDKNGVDISVERERRFEAEKTLSAMQQWMLDHNVKLIVQPPVDTGSN